MLFFHISSPSTPTFGGKKHLLLVVDDSSNFVWSFFLKEKSDQVDIMIGLIKNFKNKYNLQIQYLCCDNAGENIAFNKARYATTEWLHQKRICYSFNQVHAMHNGGKFNAYLQNGLWAEAMNTTMLLESNLLTLNRTLTQFQHFLGNKTRNILSLMQKFGEMCIKALRDNTLG